MHAGHMIPRRTGGIVFDETMTHAQCEHCNCEGNGEQQAYKAIMVEKNGLEWYESKERAQKGNTKLSSFSCKLISDEFRMKYKELLRCAN